MEKEDDNIPTLFNLCKKNHGEKGKIDPPPTRNIPVIN